MKVLNDVKGKEKVVIDTLKKEINFEKGNKDIIELLSIHKNNDEQENIRLFSSDDETVEILPIKEKKKRKTKEIKL